MHEKKHNKKNFRKSTESGEVDVDDAQVLLLKTQTAAEMRKVLFNTAFPVCTLDCGHESRQGCKKEVRRRSSVVGLRAESRQPAVSHLQDKSKVHSEADVRRGCVPFPEREGGRDGNHRKPWVVGQHVHYPWGGNKPAGCGRLVHSADWEGVETVPFHSLFNRLGRWALTALLVTVAKVAVVISLSTTMTYEISIKNKIDWYIVHRTSI